MNLSPREMTPKPISLKQRTSSVDATRDATIKTWLSAIGLLKLREFLITVDNFSIWKRHLAWAIADGKELRDYMTQRYSSSMVFMSLLLSTELSVLFNSAVVTTEVRHALQEERYQTVAFWVGIFIIVSAILSLLGLVATFTAWGMVSAVNEVNAHCVFRSSIGQYVAELPGNFIVGSIYTFSIWLILFFFLLLPVGFSSFLLLGITLGLFIHIITAFSAFGRIIMHSGAMGSNRIFDPVFESTLSPCSLHGNLLAKARETLYNGFSIRRQYAEMDPVNYDLTVLDELKRQIHPPKGDQPEFACSDPNTVVRRRPSLRRVGSLVKFDDGFDTNGKAFEDCRDRDGIQNQRAFSAIRNDQVAGGRTSHFIETWQNTVSEYSLRNAKAFLKGATDVELQRKTLIQRTGESASNENNDLEYAFDAPQSLLARVTRDSKHRSRSVRDDGASPSNELSTSTTIRPGIRQSTAYWEGNHEFPGTEGTPIDGLHDMTGKGDDMTQIPDVRSQTNERSNLLANYPNNGDYDSTPL